LFINPFFELTILFYFDQIETSSSLLYYFVWAHTCVQEGRDVISLALFLLFEEAPQPRTRFFHD
jgi:hypothetical protein